MENLLFILLTGLVFFSGGLVVLVVLSMSGNELHDDTAHPGPPPEGYSMPVGDLPHPGPVVESQTTTDPPDPEPLPYPNGKAQRQTWD